MDTSETYIKMCRLAFLDKKVKEKTHVLFVNKERTILVDEYGDFWYHCENPIINTWLPRQDQLQEMLLQGKGKIGAVLYALCRWAFQTNDFSQYFFDGGREVTTCPYGSMEQLWLAFVMKENNKVWNGEDWVVRPT